MNDWGLISIPSSRNLSDWESGNDQRLFPVSPWNQRSENHISSKYQNYCESQSGNCRSLNLSAVRKQAVVNADCQNIKIEVPEAPKFFGDEPPPSGDAYFKGKNEQEAVFKITKYDRRAPKEKEHAKNKKVISKCPHTSMKYYAKGMCK